MTREPADKDRKVADQYDRGYDYTQYWNERDYEHAAEEAALRRLLAGRRFARAADVGGGFGRLCLLLREYADHVTLAEPSRTQLEAAEKVLAGTDIEKVQTQADDLAFEAASLDLLTMIRVMHHIPEPTKEFAEIARVLRPGGTAIIEVANYGHFKNRMKHRRDKTPLPVEPVNIRTVESDQPDSIAFVNHNVDTVIRQLSDAGLMFSRKLSVSNLRSQRLKKLLPRGAMLGIEKAAQRPLARYDFGPSIFLELRRS
ncbi:MAG TPA: class I SAM-dependent methyltransferase [Aeromicrobium sp.]|nr:class I SAM-dependent methyltransferase [Aeromicrobium sp.]